MAKILVLAKSGFGKTTSYCGRQKFGIKGLDPKETYVIQCIGRATPNPEYKLTPSAEIADLSKGNRVQVDNIPGIDRFKRVAAILETLKKSPYKNIIIDDFNYLSQDFYMANAMKGGWDTPKQIGYGMGLIFDAFKSFPENKRAIKVFIKEFDGEFPAKDSLGALDSLPDEIPNDLSIVVEELRKIYG